jgi:hypothetical protein
MRTAIKHDVAELHPAELQAAQDTPAVRAGSHLAVSNDLQNISR